jgi:thioredoxin-dependent peroxiredoxin
MNTHPTPILRLVRHLAAALAAAVLLSTSPAVRAAFDAPKVGDAAPNFSLHTLDDRVVHLKALTAKRPVVLLVLRGWYGAQCPLCSRQVNDYMNKAADFAARGVQVVMVYPGPSEQLKARAQEFAANTDWPADFHFVLDPDYIFTNAYGLRWDAPRETAYPSTFIIDRENRVRFAHVSRTHGNRVSAAAALTTIDELKLK